MFFLLKYSFFVSFLALNCLETQRSAAARLPQDEVDALNQITAKMGAVNWTFNADDACGDIISPVEPTDRERNITCNCRFENDTCHITGLEIKRFGLQGVFPRELIQLRYLETIDFAYNLLTGSIPRELASLNLTSISLLANRLSGRIPNYLENFTSLTYLSLELNQFSGTLPPELGKLVNLQTLILSSNGFSGNLPAELAELINMTDFRINDNNFNGSIPDFIQNWRQLRRLEMQGSGLTGPIPSSISNLEQLADLRISDINGTNQNFPNLSSTTGFEQLVLRNCNISGEIPPYIWDMGNLKTLDLSFNQLSGELPPSIRSMALLFVFLGHNLLSGNIPIIRRGIDVDLSYNNFTRQSPEHVACQQRDININLFRSSSMGRDLGGACMAMEDFTCGQYWHSLYINCGGDTVGINGSTYEGDAEVGGNAAKFYQSIDNWGFSSSGDFMNDNDNRNIASYTRRVSSSNLDELYSTARLSPQYLTYYRYCLENGSYTVRLHFAEIEFTNELSYNSLGMRKFDIYIQENLEEKDFNIEAEASGVLTPVTKTYNATVTNGVLEIRLYWAGKGSARIPIFGAYGSLISAISVDPNFRPRFGNGGTKTKVAPIVGGVVGFCLIFSALSIFWWRHRSKAKSGRQKDLEELELQTVSFTLRQIKTATNNFDSRYKIGEGGFGPVYKGMLADGTVIAVKQLSSKSNQGNREFLNEIGMISCSQHPNLVKLYGCCIQGDQLLLVYEYLENNSLARALFGREHCQLKLDWQTRQRICVGIARGLAFLHEESRLKIVHRDIKGTNVLLDKDLNPKISDFGLAKLHEEEKTHISTRIAGTIGYMAPEYALWGYLTYKADVYSFGIVALEIVSGKHNMNAGPENSFACLLDWACYLQQSGNLMELVDEKLGSEVNRAEAERMIKIALLCTNATPSLRPTMSEAVSMLEGTTSIPDIIPEPNSYSQDLRFKAIRDHHKQMNSAYGRASQEFSSSVKSGGGFSSISTKDLYGISEESNTASRDHYNQMGTKSEVATTFVSMTVSSSTSTHDLYPINLNNQ